MPIINRNKQKQVFKQYQKRLTFIQQYCKSDTNLNHKQKQKIIGFIERAVYFCRTQKIIQYEKTCYRFDRQAVVSNIQQYKTYSSIYKMLQALSAEITTDDDLEIKDKVQLSKLLGYAIAHVLGKLNHKIMDPYLTSQKGKSVNL